MASPGPGKTKQDKDESRYVIKVMNANREGGHGPWSFKTKDVPHLLIGL